MPGDEGPVIGVLGGAGGVGASTFAGVLAAVAGCLLIDLDPASGGIDLVLGIEAANGSRWSGVRLGGGRLDPRILAEALPRWGAACVLAADEPPDQAAIPIAVDAARSLGPVVLDLGRGCAGRAVVAACDLVVVVTRADVAGVAAARATASAAGVASGGLLVRRGALRPFAAADLVGLPLVGVLPAHGRRSGRPLDPERLPRRLVRTARGVVEGCAR